MYDEIDIYDLSDCFRIFPVGMPDGADDPDDDEDPDETTTGGEDGGDDGGDDSSGSADADKDKSKGKGDDPRIKSLSAEAKKHRLALREAQAKLKEFEDKDKSETEKLSSDLKEAVERAEAAEKRASKSAKRLAFYDSGASAKFRNPATALRLLDLDDLEPDEDTGEFDQGEISKRAEALLKAEPYLGVSDDKGDEGNGSGNGKPPSAPAPGQGRKGKPSDAQALANKYPALRGRV